ncbi:MAG: CDP-alcohol phosphatidyltransferase family protein [Actinobacteria bacterium]|nr:CDP-alcohol phosphatidyltransferase family protein [Actinomycetota bacterium]
MLDRGFRAKVEEKLRPVGHGLRRAGLTANTLTLLGLLFATVTAALIGAGRFGWAAVSLIAASVPDVLDGAVAKASGTAGPRGAFFDSVVDRIADALVLGGAAWWFAGTDDPRLALLPVGVLALSFLISYERARAESLGFDARGGIMERAERLVTLGIGLAFDIVVPVLWIMAGLSAFTAVQRFVKVWRQAAPVPREHVGRPRWLERPRVRRLAEWWPALREGMTLREMGANGSRRRRPRRPTAWRRTRP